MSTVTALDAVLAVRAARRRPRVRLAVVLGGLAVALIAAFWLRVLGGDYTITFPDFWRIVGGKDIPGASFILLQSKLPRACLAALAGLALGLSGGVFQTTLRNPLASPDIVGVSAGASATAVFAIVVLHASGLSLSVAGVIGAVGTAVLVRLLAGRETGFRLVLVGVTAAAGSVAVVQYLFTRADVYDAQLALRWLTGSVSSASWPEIRALGLCLVVLVPLTAYFVQSARMLDLGHDLATGLGVARWRGDALLLCAVLLCAVTVAAAGPIAFVAFASGPISRRLNGGRTTLAGAALVGAAAVVFADYLGAYALPGINLPVGVVTGAFGAPVLLWLLTTSRRTA